jgi:hypothetical protein
MSSKSERSVALTKYAVDIICSLIIRTTLRRIFKKEQGRTSTGLSWLRTGTVGCSCESSNKILRFMKCRDFLD